MLNDVILRIPTMYRLFQWANGADKMRRIYAKEYMRLDETASILDIACGTADILNYVEDRAHTGVDLSQKYIEYDKRRYRKKENAQFICADANEYLQADRRRYDLILLMGIMHHLNDGELRSCLNMLKTQIDCCGGRLLTLDGVYQPGLTRFERALLDGDRGKHIRTLEQYLAIFMEYFPDYRYEIRKNLYFLPYNILLFYK